jgi:glycosyltransferase involved in cell wall biosynthesis
MRVALDATPLVVPTGGSRRYVEELGCALADCFPADEFYLVSDQPFEFGWLRHNLRRGRRPSNWFARRWWTFGLPREIVRTGAEIFHGTDFSVPYLPLSPSVLTLLDLSPWMDHGGQRGSQRVRRRAPFLLGLGIATMVITLSEAVRSQAIARFKLHPDRVVAVPLAAAQVFHPSMSSPRPPYFLYAGTLEPRKNLPAIVDAWRELRRSHPVELVLAGRRRAEFPEPRAEPGLEVTGQVTDQELASLYSGAIATLYPSLYEGFGLPVLEAMQCGSPVIASRDPAVSEVSGSAALLLDPRDTNAWLEAMRAMLTRPEWRAAWTEQGLVRAAGFSWNRTAVQTRGVYQEAVARFGS